MRDCKTMIWGNPPKKEALAVTSIYSCFLCWGWFAASYRKYTEYSSEQWLVTVLQVKTSKFKKHSCFNVLNEILTTNASTGEQVLGELNRKIWCTHNGRVFLEDVCSFYQVLLRFHAHVLITWWRVKSKRES